jgi:hypothetical protein
MTRVAAPASEFRTTCPLRGCDARLGESGLTEAHLLDHVRRDEIDLLIPGMIRLWHAHLRLVALDGLSFETIRSSLADDVVNVLGSGGEHRLDRIAVAVGERPEVVRGCLARLVERGVVTKRGKGVYALAVAASTGASR